MGGPDPAAWRVCGGSDELGEAHYQHLVPEHFAGLPMNSTPREAPDGVETRLGAYHGVLLPLGMWIHS